MLSTIALRPGAKDMSETRRFVGGVADGWAYELDEDCTSVQVKGRTPPPGLIVSEPRRSADVLVTYTRRAIVTPHGEFFYFAPDDWSDAQALQNLFELAPDATRPRAA
jgi:hypothetical protein